MDDDERSTRVRVGVTGHRTLTDTDQIVAGVREALELIRGAYPRRQLTVLSSLAEGADRLVAEEVLRTPGSRLIAILPFPPQSYAEDFGPSGSASNIQFAALLAQASEVHVVPAASVRSDGYRRAGVYVVDHSDVLVALWDGRSKRGRGGTAEIVEHARAIGRPLAIVRACNGPPRSADIKQQGQLTAERLPLSNADSQ